MAHDTRRRESEYFVSDNNNFSQHPQTSTARPRNQLRSHSRSSSWSHTSWLHTNTSSTSMASIFSPMRVIQGIVPTLSNSNSISAGSATSTASPQQQRVTSSSAVYSSRNQANSTDSHTRSDVSSIRHSRQSSSVEIDLGDDDNPPPPSPTAPQDNGGANRGQDHMEFLGTITWVEKALPFILLLLSRIMWDHRLG